MPPQVLEVIYEDNHLLAVIKPAGLPTMGVSQGQPSLVTLAKEYIKRRYDKPGNVYLGVVSRLDSLATGVIVLARTSKAAARLTEQFRSREVQKTYWAAVEGVVRPAAGVYEDWLVHDESQHRMEIVPPLTEGAKEARLSYRQLATAGGVSLLEIELETGRKHQIRLQLAHHGHAVVGDRKYGSRRAFPAGIALHARRLVLQHPVRKEPLELLAPLPRAWRVLALLVRE